MKSNTRRVWRKNTVALSHRLLSPILLFLIGPRGAVAEHASCVFGNSCVITRGKSVGGDKVSHSHCGGADAVRIGRSHALVVPRNGRLYQIREGLPEFGGNSALQVRRLEAVRRGTSQRR